VSELPADFVIDRVGPLGHPQASCFRGIGSRTKGVSSHVGDTRGLCGGPGGRHSSRGGHDARGTASDETPANLIGGTELAARKRSGSSDRISWAIITRSFRFEQDQHAISAVGGPHRDNATIGFAQSL
jgi:hypothetical protein